MMKKASLDDQSKTLSEILGRFSADFHVDASDDIGRKTELPWVRPRHVVAELFHRSSERRQCGS